MYDNGQEKTYHLTKFLRSNQSTCIPHAPDRRSGRARQEGRRSAEHSTDKGEIALGKNALIGFMTWEGYNYEDAVLLNERLVRDDVYTSIHIEEYESESRDTKLGRKKSPATCRTSVRMRCATSMSAASSVLVPRSARRRYPGR